MKILFLIAVWVNIVFFLWESNFGDIDTDYEGDINATKQILLQSELPKDEVVEKQKVTTGNKANELIQDQLPKHHVENVATPEIKKDNKAEILQKVSESTTAPTNDKTKEKENLNKQADTKSNQNDTPKLEESSHNEITLYVGHCYQIGPFENTSVFSEWVKLNKIDSSSVSLLKEESKSLEQYMVYYPAAENIEESNKNMEKIKTSGITDAWLFQRGEFKGEISLGLYDREEPAKLRVEQVAAMNINTEIKRIHRKKSALFSKISTKNNKSKRVVFLSDNQKAIDCETEL